MQQVIAKLLETRQLAPEVWLHRYGAAHIAREGKPGQFVNIRVATEDFPLLRRPFGIAASDGGETIDIIFKVRGVGTRILAQCEKNCEIDILGPLGKAFDINSSQKPLLVAGGLGIAPLLFLAQTLSGRGRKPIIIFGAKTAEQLIVRDKIVQVASEVVSVTEDGSAGEKGLATNYVETYAAQADAIYACGPEAMLQTVAAQAARHSLFCQVLLERQMACGVGACLGCVVATKHGYRLTCKDGPVFRSDEILWTDVPRPSDDWCKMLNQ